jgi:hypothetical protein
MMWLNQALWMFLNDMIRSRYERAMRHGALQDAWDDGVFILLVKPRRPSMTANDVDESKALLRSSSAKRNKLLAVGSWNLPGFILEMVLIQQFLEGMDTNHGILADIITMEEPGLLKHSS